MIQYLAAAQDVRLSKSARYTSIHCNRIVYRDSRNRKALAVKVEIVGIEAVRLSSKSKNSYAMDAVLLLAKLRVECAYVRINPGPGHGQLKCVLKRLATP